jgi:5-(carboxyamino)imidazole ribonucleotide synthase
MQKYDIGIIGGGQLGKMLIEEGLRYNVSFSTLDSDLASPASGISSNHITGSLQDADALRKLAASATISTYEIEEINVNALLELQQEGHHFIPAPETLQLIKNKGLQKQFYKKSNLPTAAFAIVQKSSDWQLAIEENLPMCLGNKIVAKLCEGGYDGKGVSILNTNDILNDSFIFPFDGPCVLEEFIPCQKEISIIVARALDGEVKCFPPVEMDMDPIANLITYQICPASISDELLKKANSIATDVVNKLNGYGLFAIEMFITKNNEILINEMAPRPHNSGHHTIEANYTSQYEQLIRILLKKPLGDTNIIQPSAMVNIVGANNFSGNYKLQFEKELLQMQGVYIHMYGKKESRPARKLGHITIMATDMDRLRLKANSVLTMCKVVAV